MSRIILVTIILELLVNTVHGQTVVYTNNFEGTVGPEWSNRTTSLTPNGARRFLGRFGSQTTTLTLSNLPAHTNLSVLFDLFIILTMDGNAPGHSEWGPDLWRLSVEGGPTLIQTTFSNFQGEWGYRFEQAFPDTSPGGQNPALTGATEIDTLGYIFVVGSAMDSVYRLTFTFPHTASTLKLHFSGTLIENFVPTTAVNGESWGLDNVKVEIQNIIPPPTPNNFTAQLRTDQSIGLEWISGNGEGGGAQVDNDITYILEKKTGLSVWQKIGETAVNVYKWIDTPVQPNENITYRVSAKNTNGTSATVQSNTIRTPDSRWQLKIYDPDSDRWVNCPKDKEFNPDWGTAIIVHGWNPDNNRLCILIGICNWDGDLNTNKNGTKKHWTREIAKLLHQRIDNINIVAWDWMQEATKKVDDAFLEIDSQIIKLTNALRSTFPSNYNMPIHMMGHSFGTVIIADTARLLREFSTTRSKTFVVNQLTLWDPTDKIPFTDYIFFVHDIASDIIALRSTGAYVELYNGITNQGSHNANILLNIPTAYGHSVHQWYDDTISPSYAQVVYDDDKCLSNAFNGNIGFDNSILLTGTENPNLIWKAAPECAENGTLLFSKLCFCSTPFCAREVYGLTEKKGCNINLTPSQKTNNPTKKSIKTQRTGQGGGAQVDELLAQYSEEIFIDPEWDYINLEYNFISAPAPADLEISFIQGDQKYSLFSINSDLVFNEEFKKIGLRKISTLQNQNVTLLIELRSMEPDAEVVIQNISFWEDPHHNNTPPIAQAGMDQAEEVECGDVAKIMLDGSSTSDPDANDILQYSWILQDGLLATGINPVIELPAGEYNITLVVRDNSESISTDEVKIIIYSNCSFIRGDSNRDGTVDISDAINILSFLFIGAGKNPCADASDANDDGIVDISDAVYILNFLFSGGKDPLVPYPILGYDETEDTLYCNGL